MSNTSDNRSFLGRGWSFPPRFTRVEGGTSRVDMSEDEQDIRESLQILLSTSLGERTMLPGFGCDLTAMTFESLTTGLVTYIRDLVRTAILRHEPRIILEKTNLRTETAGEGLVLIEVNYLIRNTNTRTNFVYPYYINEATDL